MNLAQQLQQLYSQFGHHQGITIELQKDLVAIGIHNQSATATVFLQGAQIASYQPHGEQPLLFLSAQNSYQEGKPLRGGIPVCWPWFGDLQRNPDAVQEQYQQHAASDSTPAHGFARNLIWQLESINTDQAETTQLVLTLPADSVSAQGLENTSLQMEINVGTSLQCKLTTTNTGQTPISLSQALHTYLAVNDVRNIRISQLSETQYIDALDDWQSKTQQSDISVSEEVDRIYANSPAYLKLHDPDWQRCIDIHSNSSRSTVVWNPWIEKSQRLSDFDNADYLKMMCVETANVMDDAVIDLQPGASHCLDLTLSLSPISH